jgi:hypothetical protein
MPRRKGSRYSSPARGAGKTELALLTEFANYCRVTYATKQGRLNAKIPV